MGGRSAGKGGLKLRVVSFGKDRSGLFQPGVEEYAERLSHVTALELLELPAGRTAADECQTLLGKLEPGERLVALDERGKAFTSVQLAGWLETERVRPGRLTFVIGGDEGLAPAVRERAQLTLQLSAMVFPHRLARLMLVEQLYRAFTLLRGEPYHK